MKSEINKEGEMNGTAGFRNNSKLTRYRKQRLVGGNEAADLRWSDQSDAAASGNVTVQSNQSQEWQLR